MIPIDRNSIRILLILTLLPALLYINGIGIGFLIDDAIIIDTNTRPLLTEGPLSIFAKGEKFQSIDLPYYRPVMELSFYFDRTLWGKNPVAFHITNILFHTLNTLLVFALASSLIGGRVIPLLAGLFFAVHPVHTESVDLIQGRSDLLTSLFFLSSLILFIQFVHRSTEKGSPFLYAASLVTCILALLTKEMAATLPLMLLLYSILFRKPAQIRGRSVSPWLLCAPFFVLLGLYLWLRVSILGVPSIPANLGSPLLPRLLLIPETFTTYIKLLIWPFSLTFLHSLPSPHSPSDPRFFLPLTLFSFLITGAALLYRWSKEASFGALWIFIALLPVSNLVPIEGFVLAERYLYIPSVGFTILGALVAGRALRSDIPTWGKGLVGVTIGAILIVFSSATIWRNNQWSDQLGIYQEMVEASPNSSFAHNNLALQYLERGKVDEAIVHLKRAVALDPNYAIAHNNLGVAHFRKGLPAEAAQAYRRAIQLNPRYAEAYNNLGVLFEESGRIHEAEIHYRKALQIDPHFTRAIDNLARLTGRAPSRSSAHAPETR
ncbi:MAG: tetratricopeptide repeat protein [Candidatus Methylomirabilales bacterium]